MNCHLKISVNSSTKQSPLNFTMQTLYFNCQRLIWVRLRMLIPWSPDGNGKALHLLIVPTPGEGRVQGSIDKVVHLCILLAPSHCSSSGNRNFTFTGRSWCSWWRGEAPSPPAPCRGCSCTTTALLSTTPHYIYAMVALDIFHCLHLMVFPLFVTAPTQQS